MEGGEAWGCYVILMNSFINHSLGSLSSVLIQILVILCVIENSESKSSHLVSLFGNWLENCTQKALRASCVWLISSLEQISRREIPLWLNNELREVSECWFDDEIEWNQIPLLLLVVNKKCNQEFPHFHH